MLGWSARPAGATTGFWPLAGADLALAPSASQAPRHAPTPGIDLAADLEADLASVGLGAGCLAPRLDGSAALAAVGLGARLLLPKGTLGAWSASGWQRLRTGWLFRGDSAGGCAFLLAEIYADVLEIEDPEAGRNLRLAPHTRRMLELEIEPAESAPAFAIEERELAGVG